MVAVLCVAGCSGSGEPSPGTASEQVATAPSESDAAEPRQEEVPQLALPDSGNGSKEYPRARPGDVLNVGITCRGVGRVDVWLPRVKKVVSGECRDAKVAQYRQQFSGEAAERSGTAVVTAPDTVEWLLVVGRTQAAPEE
ncbi:hypothetical protein ABT026_26640 [Streptomyces sp. NPDC002734]|uniref:hypothetical protein n=1 Tax=Streptomyces sp. NPDC002734 TaxID=3154426 RepID=UPI00332E3768